MDFRGPGSLDTRRGARLPSDDMKEILTEIAALVSRGQTGALVSILSSKGSLPMSRRSKMLILPDGTQRGTVGGGCLEAEVHARGQAAIRAGRASRHQFTLTETKAGAEGLNCGGTVQMLIEPVGRLAAGDSSELFVRALEAMDAQEETVMATAVGADPSADADGVIVTGKALIGWKGIRCGWGELTPGASLAPAAVEEGLGILGQDRAVVVEGPVSLFLETMSVPPTLYLFGGGHVSLAVARVARTAGFRVVVIDDRPAFANTERFPDAEGTHVLPMETAVSSLPIGRDAYVVAVTRGHQHDEPVIEQAIRTPAAYIGMIGSRRKVEIMWSRLKERGATAEQLARVHAPIGLPIGADSPGEIAVAIVAQLIEVRRARSS